MFDRVNGVSLKDFILDKSGQLKAMTLRQRRSIYLSLFKQIVEGIQFIHKFGIIHCDIKHLNIVVEEILDNKTGQKSFKAYVIDLGSGVECSLE